jgi:transcription initiation factor TFIID subunit 1
MLRLHGEGDPTGRGEAFSFIRISMKDIFVKAGEDYEQKMGNCLIEFLVLHVVFTFSNTAEAENRPKSAHRYNVAEQQLIYKSEIERIWKAQFDSLSRKDEPRLLPEDENKDVVKKPLQRQATQPYISAISPMPGAGPSARSSPAFSRGSSLEREGSVGPEGSRKILRIKRLVCARVLTFFFKCI